MSPETRVGITKVTAVELYFSDYYGVDEHVLDAHGAFDISVVSDLPLFVDPFLLFNSPKAEYQGLHEEIVRYLRFLRDQAAPELRVTAIRHSTTRADRLEAILR
jgi:hypothetical protein